jgi:predicted Rossmann fold nucleotide-binding protein DprA/Smf involved in DNA uptake
MTDPQARIVEYLRRACIACTAHEIANNCGIALGDTLDDLRALENAGQVVGTEPGWYRIAGGRLARSVAA